MRCLDGYCDNPEIYPGEPCLFCDLPGIGCRHRVHNHTVKGEDAGAEVSRDRHTG